AAVNLHRAQESPRYSDTARLYLSWIYYRNGNHASMRREWKEFVKRLPDERSRIKLAAAHPEIDYRALEKAAAKRVENTPRHAALSQPTESSLQESAFKDSAAFYLQKGLKAGKQDRSREAARWLEKTVGFDPSCTQAWFQLGVIYKSLGKNDMSADCFEKSLGRDSRTRQRTSEKTEEEPIVLNNDETRDTNPLIGAQEERTPGGQESDGRATTTAVAAGTPGSSGAGTSTEWNPPAEKTDLEAPEVVNPLASTEENVFQTLRDVIAAGIVSKSDPGLLRKRIGLLTLILGTLFILTMLGEKLMFRKILPGRWFFSRKTAGTDPGRHGIGNVSSDHLIRKKKRQIEEVLTTQLAAKQQKNQHILAGPDATYHGWDNEKPGENSNIELEFQPVGHNGAYGADIARRIKEELLGATESTRMETTRGVLVRGKHDQQTRLIRQLRSKDWTIGDIAQEMSISREEVKWALANRPVSNVIQKKGNSEEVHRTSYGQAQGLFGGVLNGLRPGRTGRGVNSESQINP
ncbi:MAG: tetratricopeptide repeat protein, partial [Gemmatimonadota bacterium]|nr:tetratricopeptide repeat protein [Gemmatimonadota bacterium]